MTKVPVVGSCSPSSTAARIERDLLLGLAQRRRGEVGVGLVPAAAGKGDLARVTPHVGAPLGEDQARIVRPAVERQQDRGLGHWRVSGLMDGKVARRLR